MPVRLLWPHQCFKTIYFFSLGLSGEGAAAGKPAGAGAGPSGGAAEEALRVGWPRDGVGRRQRWTRQFPASTAPHPAPWLLGGIAALFKHAALPEHSELHAAQQPLLGGDVTALHSAPDLHADQHLLADPGLHPCPDLHPSSVLYPCPDLHSPTGLHSTSVLYALPAVHPIPALHHHSKPKLPKTSVAVLVVHGRRLPTPLAVSPAQDPSEQLGGRQTSLEEIQHLRQIRKLAEERGKCQNSALNEFALLMSHDTDGVNV